MSKSPSPSFIDVYDFKTAYQAADANPGTIVTFEGQLPSGFFTRQRIITVPDGQNGLTLADKLAKGAFSKASSIVISSDVEKGTHVVATFGRLEKPETRPA